MWGTFYFSEVQNRSTAGGANHSRLTSMTYPNGWVVNYNYTSALDAPISRLSSMSDTSATLEGFDYPRKPRSFRYFFTAAPRGLFAKSCSERYFPCVFVALALPRV